ncbi:hypothetical protein NN561_003624 [Cricetulus griseus]
MSICGQPHGRDCSLLYLKVGDTASMHTQERPLSSGSMSQEMSLSAPGNTRHSASHPLSKRTTARKRGAQKSNELLFAKSNLDASSVVFLSGLQRAGHPAASAAVHAACSRLRLGRQAKELRAWRSGRRHRCGLAGGGGESEEDGGGRRGTGSEVPARNPDHSAACREERFSPLLSAAYTATGSRGDAPGSPSLPPPHCQATSFAVSSSLPAELRPRGGRPVISERHAKTRGAGGGWGDAAAGSRTLWAPRLQAGLILEPRLPPPLAGLEERTKVRCRGSSQESSLPFSERARARH